MNQRNNTFMQNQVDGKRAEQQHLIQECLHVLVSLHRKVNTLKYFAIIPALFGGVRRKYCTGLEGSPDHSFYWQIECNVYNVI